MGQKLKGGVETIIAIVIVVGLVILGIVLAIIPIMNETNDLSDTAQGGISGLGSAMGYDPVRE